MTTSRPHKLLYKAPIRDFEFLLWEQFTLHKSAGLDRNLVEGLLARVGAFAEGPLTASYRESDEQEARLEDGGRVRTPDSYPQLISAYRGLWNTWQSAPADSGSASNELVQNLIVEMLVGANPSFVTYVGFNGPALKLINAYGSPELQAQYCPALRSLQACACLCITEKTAGSDLSLLTSVATRLTGGGYQLAGHKWLISAGMHELTENIYYVVLARTDAAQRGMTGLSCFIVPRYRFDSDGNPSIDNGIRCREVVQKMGLRGCANTHLEFSQDGLPTIAYLLGSTDGRGLQQLMMMMAPARVSTGIYALGIASAAYETACAYASVRIQGKRFDQAMSARADNLPIKEHPDVRRMRLDMLAVTTGCRALIALLGWCQMQLRVGVTSAEYVRIATDLLDILLPIVKAYTSDQAWRVTEYSIQTLGGVGYLRDYPVEQQARDCKVLSIWEGTNHLQSLFLVRDKLGLCLRSDKLETLRAQITTTMQRATEVGGFESDVDHLNQALRALLDAALAIGASVRKGRINLVPEFSCDFQAGLAEVAVAWQLLEGALIARSALRATSLDTCDTQYYELRIAATKHFTSRRLPQTTALLGVVERGLA